MLFVSLNLYFAIIALLIQKGFFTYRLVSLFLNEFILVNFIWKGVDKNIIEKCG